MLPILYARVEERSPATEQTVFPTPVRHLRLWTSLTLVIVVALGLFAFVQAPELARNYGGANSTASWVIVILFVLSLANVAIARFLMLPALASREDASPDKVATMAFMLSLTPAIYGMISAALSGERVVSLPFTLLSLFAAVDLWAHFAGAYERARASRTAEAVDTVEVPIRDSDHGASEPLP